MQGLTGVQGVFPHILSSLKSESQERLSGEGDVGAPRLRSKMTRLLAKCLLDVAILKACFPALGNELRWERVKPTFSFLASVA